ncbi:MAG TPA: muconolactone Delta-isomerase family protein, partial [Solirubrobacteraceae bacterium]|nr:muconolactone Delta-isomerase family protein [Solirubrobacteraceae bacterium]
MEFLVEFEVTVPKGTPEREVAERNAAESAAAAGLARQGHLVRLWRARVAPGKSKAMGVYRAASRAELDALLSALPLSDWMRVIVTTLAPHPNDPGSARTGLFQLPEPRLTPVYRLEATLGQALELGDTAQGRRRIVPLTGGTFTGTKLSGVLVAGASADWQIVLPDETALADVRYTLRRDDGALLYVRSRGVRHGSPEVLARLARGEEVDAGEYTFRTATRIEAAVPELEWLNKGVFISVGGRRP